jgi:SAM-dependent methyltransferase
MRRLKIYAQMLFRYRPREFWNDVLSESFDLRGVGHYRLSEDENRQMYERKRDLIAEQLERFGVAVGPATRVLEIGCGVGYWTEYLKGRGVLRYTGNDITPVSVSTLRTRYPDYEFIQGDAGEIALPPVAFDLVMMIDVTQHITDDAAFERAMRNVWQAVASGGTFVVTYWDPTTNKMLATRLRLNRIEKPRALSAYTAVWGGGSAVLSTIAFNDKHLAVIRKTG